MSDCDLTDLGEFMSQPDNRIQTEISLPDRYGSNELDAYPSEGGAIISVFEFDCSLTIENVKRLRDVLNNILEVN